MSRSRTITMGGQEYTVHQLPIQDNKLWRDDLTEPLRKVIAVIRTYQNIEINNIADLGALLDIAADVLLDSIDMVNKALFAYVPALAADRERILREAYDDEAIEALGVCLSLAYPLGQLLQIVGGLNLMPISTNLALQNGASGHNRSARRRAIKKTS